MNAYDCIETVGYHVVRKHQIIGFLNDFLYHTAVLENVLVTSPSQVWSDNVIKHDQSQFAWQS